MSETQIVRAILDYLAARRVLAYRMNTGAIEAEYKGKKRFMRFGVPGMADILAFKKRKTCYLTTPAIPNDYRGEIIMPLWLEVKTDKGKQSELQKSFQAQVEEEGHRYAVVRSIEDVAALL
jgi:hypothetical protein